MRMTEPLRGLYPITPDDTDTTNLLARVATVLGAGPALLQYRNKRADAGLRRAQARALLPLCRRAGVPLIINDDLALALEIGADGVHLGGDDGDAAAARRALGAKGILGLSCYGEWERARRGARLGADYLAFGAMYPSATKPQAPLAPQGLLNRARQEFGLPVVAIGGIRLHNAAALIAAGADMLAVISDVFEAEDPAARCAAYQRLF